MGSAEFEFGAIPRAFTRIMYNLGDYIYINSKIFTKEKNELILFSNKKQAIKVLKSIKSFINNPYQLKEYSELDKISNSSIYDKGYKKLSTNFWWSIEYDWMAFLNSNKDLFARGIIYDYYNWWLAKSFDERKKEYAKSLKI